jgi:hypothetical protein
MAESIAQQVLTFLKKNPKSTNKVLYKNFPKVRENTLRNYKSRFNKSLLQMKSGRKTKSQTRKAAQVDKKSSLRSNVFDFFRENPGATNQTLYEEFSQYSKNKLRHYKASFFKSPAENSTKEKTATRPAALKKVTQHLKNKASTIASLEKRIERIENQVDKLSRAINIPARKKTPVKSAFTDTAGNIEKKVKELEESLATYIGEKRKKIRTEMSSLDDVQQIVSDKINSFLKGFK